MARKHDGRGDSAGGGTPSIDAADRRAEQAIRPAVVTRKVCGGNRTGRGVAAPPGFVAPLWA